jgi:ribosomal protein L31E
MAKIVSGSVLEFSVKGGNVHVQALRKSSDAAKKYSKSLGVLSKEQNITFRNSRNLHKANKKVIGSFSVLRSKLLLVGFATTMFTKTIGRLIAASNEQELAERKLSQALTSTGRATEFSKHEMMSFASALQKTTAFGDETIIRSQALLATFTSVGKDVFPNATRAILDVSAAMGQDLQQTTIQVGKALNDPVQGMAALRRVGIQLSETQQAQVKRFVELNQVSDAQKIILGELQTQFGGMAKAVSETSAGALMQMKNAVGDTAEALGDLLAPIVITFAKSIKFAAEAVSGLVHKFIQLGNEITLVKMLTQAEAEVESFKKSIEKMDFDKLVRLAKDLSKKLPPNSIYSALPPKLQLVADKALIVNQRITKLTEAGAKLSKGLDLGAQDLEEFIAKQFERADAMMVEEAMIEHLIKKYPLLAETLGITGKAYKELEASQGAIGEIAKANAEIFKNNLDFQLMQIDLQAEKYRQMKLDEVAIDQFVNDAKKEIALQHLEDNNAIYEASFAGYDAFVNTLVDTDMTGTERRIKAAEAFKNSLIKFGAEMLKDHIKNMIVKNVISKTGESAAIASALVSGKAIASAYAVPASLASTASFGASAVTGQAALVASIAATKAISSFAQGGDFVTNGAQLIMVGDNPGGKERVQVTPLSSPSARQSSGGGGVTVNISGGIVQDDYVRNELIPALNRATGTGTKINA